MSAQTDELVIREQRPSTARTHVTLVTGDDGPPHRVDLGLRLVFSTKNHALYAYSAEGDRLWFKHDDGSTRDLLFVPPDWAADDTRNLLVALANGAGHTGHAERAGVTSAGAGNHSYVLVK